MRAALSDHSGGTCVHSPPACTIVSFVAEVQAGRLHVTRGNPCQAAAQTCPVEALAPGHEAALEGVFGGPHPRPLSEAERGDSRGGGKRAECLRQRGLRCTFFVYCDSLCARFLSMAPTKNMHLCDSYGIALRACGSGPQGLRAGRD